MRGPHRSPSSASAWVAAAQVARRALVAAGARAEPASPGDRAALPAAGPSHAHRPTWRGWPLLLGLNLALGALVWVFHLTDYGLASALSEWWFPLVVGLVGLFSLRYAARLPKALPRALVRLGAAVTLSGGGFYVVALPLALAGIVLLPWAFYRLAYGLEEMAAETAIQDVVSPVGTWSARVYFQPVGENAVYNGHVSVRAAHPALPLLERRLYYVPATRVATAEPAAYVRWVDDDTLYVAETNDLISVAPQRARRPTFLAVPLGWLVQLRSSLDPTHAASLRDVPMYPGRVQNEGAGYNAPADTFQRWYGLPRQHPDEVVDWYRTALASPPWSLVDSKLNRRDNIPNRPPWKRYCLVAERREAGGDRGIYYWEVMGFDRERDYVWVNVSAPHPNNLVCQPYVNQPAP
jgi:hypothetical protein